MRQNNDLDMRCVMDTSSPPVFHWKGVRFKLNEVAKWLIIGGLILIGLGVIWQLFGRLFPLGRLPGDIVIEKENVRIYFPIVTMIVISIVLSLILNIAGRFFR